MAKKTRKPCPICGKPSVEKYHPFCSDRCADVDLNRWLTGGYVIPAREDDRSDDEAPDLSRDLDEDER